ncbi:MAG: Synerg-CTERM sorting domain-containing protein, partial [Synergistaceae bacterium]|nr:Synerg-CTERM sorting domain-containing protein [Synergistaceae bacterium]
VIEVEPDELLSIFGVVIPIPCEVIASPNKSYTIQDRIAKIHYSISEGGKEVLSYDKPIALDRHYYDSWSQENVKTGECLYEFKHDFILSAYENKTLSMDITAYTSKDNTLAASQSLTIKVKDNIRPKPSSGGCNADWAVLLIFAAIPIALKKKED